jgi:hypothetical protein
MVITPYANFLNEYIRSYAQLLYTTFFSNGPRVYHPSVSQYLGKDMV